MNTKDFFEKYFKYKKDYSYSKSLLHFFNDDVQHRLPAHKLNVMDIGAGDYSIFEDVKNFEAKITALDFSKNAILRSPKSNIIYLEGSITNANFFPDASFDLIFDSHCFNCITDEFERAQGFKNIYKSLKPDGIFAGEMMVQPTGNKVSMPFKIIKTTIEIEEELLAHGFKIIYFIISAQNGFINETSGVEVKCDLLKVIAQK